MPNATTIENNNNNNNVTSAKARKSKKKSLATNDVSPSSQEQLFPTNTATETAEANLENVNKNPYIEVIFKRIRTLKKKMSRIEKCEEDLRDGKQLNNDQLQSVERKNEIAGALKECEEIVKQYETVEKEELKNQKILKKEQQEEREQAISKAVEEAETAHRQSIISLIKFLRLAQLRSSGVVRLTDAELGSIDTLHNLFMNISEDTKIDQVNDQWALECMKHLNKLSNGDENIITKSLANGINETVAGISYSHVRNLIENPPILNNVEQTEQENSQVEREVITNQEERANHNEDGLGDVYTTVPAGGIQFMLPRETPQALDPMISQNHASYAYSGTDVDKNLAITDAAVVENDFNEYQQQQQQQQQQSFSETYVEQREYALDQQQYSQEQPPLQNFTEQSEQNQLIVDQQDKEPQQVIDVQTDVQQQQQQQQQQQMQQPLQQHPQQQSSQQQPTTQTLQQSDQPPPLSHPTGNHRGFRGGHRGGSRGNYRGQGRRDFHRESGNYRGNRGNNNNSGPRNNRGGGNGGGYQGGPRGGGGGNQYNKQRPQ